MEKLVWEAKIRSPLDISKVWPREEAKRREVHGLVGTSCSKSRRWSMEQVPGSGPTCVSSEVPSRGGLGGKGPVLTFPRLEACVPFNAEVFRMVDFVVLISVGLRQWRCYLTMFVK